MPGLCAILHNGAARAAMQPRNHHSSHAQNSQTRTRRKPPPSTAAPSSKVAPAASTPRLFALADLRRRKLGEISGQLVRLPAPGRRWNSRQDLPDRLDERTALECSTGNHFPLPQPRCAANCYMRVAHRRVEIYTRRRSRLAPN